MGPLEEVPCRPFPILDGTTEPVGMQGEFQNIRRPLPASLSGRLRSRNGRSFASGKRNTISRLACERPVLIKLKYRPPPCGKRQIVLA